MPKKKLIGHVVSDKMDKTIVVTVDTIKTHSKYKKQYFVAKKYFVSDEKKKAKKGDLVSIVEFKPFSKKGRFKLDKIIEKGKKA